MSRFTVEHVTREDAALVRLRDTATGAFADVWPGFGNNCIALQIPAPDGRLVDLVLGPDRLSQVREQPSWWGIPLLFPFPSRLPQATYRFRGKTYTFAERDAQGNAGHGFAKTRPWTISHTSDGDDGAAVRSTFASAEHPETLDGYPFPYRVDATYRLDADGLRLDFEVANAGDGAMPFGYGAHPYFRIPIGSDAARGACRVFVPAARRWNGQAVQRIGEGDLPAWDDLCQPVSGDFDLRTPKPLAERLYDGVFTDLTLVDGLVECYVSDPVSGLDAVMRATPNHPNVVVYTPQGRPGVCFEPWTCPPNTFNLADRGAPQHGLVVLAPGERWQGTMWLSLRRSSTPPAA
jgi:aldose 1-epimerase